MMSLTKKRHGKGQFQYKESNESFRSCNITILSFRSLSLETRGEESSCYSIYFEITVRRKCQISRK